MKKYDVIIIGAGAAGLSAARAAISHGRSVAVIDMGATPARKVAVSGGGRCNFTNAAATRDRYFGTNPDFVRGALARVTPDDILDWARRHNISWSEKSAGQYFGDNAQSVVNALVSDTRGAKIILGDAVLDVQHNAQNLLSAHNRVHMPQPASLWHQAGFHFRPWACQISDTKLQSILAIKSYRRVRHCARLSQTRFPQNWREYH